MKIEKFTPNLRRTNEAHEHHITNKNSINLLSVSCQILLTVPTEVSFLTDTVGILLSRVCLLKNPKGPIHSPVTQCAKGQLKVTNLATARQIAYVRLK